MEEQRVTFGRIPSGHKTKRDWTGDNANWYIQEKVDGSQFSFYNDGKTLRFFNRGKKKLPPYAGPFKRTANALSHLDFPTGVVFHGEAIGSRQHNVLTYGRMPRYGFVLFGAERDNKHLTPSELTKLAKETDLELAPIIYVNKDESVDPYEKICELMQERLQSFLGGDAEGMVLKHLSYTNSKGEVCASKFKFVYPKFQEVHKNKRTKHVETVDGFLEGLVTWFPLQPRLSKAAFRLRDNGKIDIDSDDPETRRRNGTRVKRELRRDLEKECEQLIKDELWVFFSKRILDAAVEGAVEEYVNL